MTRLHFVIFQNEVLLPGLMEYVYEGSQSPEAILIKTQYEKENYKLPIRGLTLLWGRLDVVIMDSQCWVESL
ncbi:MAG: hypothetical protein ACFFAE_22205 [Candidatus Hodarchaeota archaeon]